MGTDLFRRIRQNRFDTQNVIFTHRTFIYKPEFMQILSCFMNRQLQKTIKKLDDIGDQLGDMGLVQGEVAEELFYIIDRSAPEIAELEILLSPEEMIDKFNL